jgi:hypothetical protein
MNAMCSIVAYRLTPVSVPEFQVLLDKMLKKRVNDKLRREIRDLWYKEKTSDY